MGPTRQQPGRAARRGRSGQKPRATIPSPWRSWPRAARPDAGQMSRSFPEWAWPGVVRRAIGAGEPSGASPPARTTVDGHRGPPCAGVRRSWSLSAGTTSWGRSRSPARFVRKPSRASAACTRWGCGRRSSAGTSKPAVVTAGAELGIDDVQAALSPAGKVAAVGAERSRSRSVLMVGDGVNDAPALAAASIGCAIGSGSGSGAGEQRCRAARQRSERRAGRGHPGASDLRGNGGRNFGWAIGYNIAALPLAAAGLIDPLVAAMAMGLSSLLVVANSLRLARLRAAGPGRKCEARGSSAGPGASACRWRSRSCCFAALTVVGQAVSPARGQSLLPELPAISTTRLALGGSAEVYLSPGAPGLNELHVLHLPTAHAHDHRRCRGHRGTR